MAPLPKFEYSPLREDEHFRLLTIHPGWSFQSIACTLSHARLSDSFEALSYTWGDPNAKATIKCNGSSMEITASLLTALQHLRKRDDPVTLWIDQICINQADLDEKGRQIGLMGKIYSSARRVVVWLGPESDTTKTALKFAKTFRDVMLPSGTSVESRLTFDGHLMGGMGELMRGTRFYSYEGHGLPRRQHKKWKALKEFLSRPWFSRIWVIQEAALARELVVHCGKHTIPWGDLHLLVQLLYGNVPPMFFGVETEVMRLPGDHIRDITKILVARDEGIVPDLFELLWRHRSYQATDPRDKLYALCGLAGLSTVADYRMSAAELFTRTMIQFLMEYSAGTLDLPEEEPRARALLPKSNISIGLPLSIRGRLTSLICAAGTAFQNQKGMPSWVPDWSCSTTLFPIFGYTPPGRQSRVIEAGGKALGAVEVGGLEFVVENRVATLPQLPETISLRLEGKLLDPIKVAGRSHIRHDTPFDTPAQQQALTAWFLESAAIAQQAGTKDPKETLYSTISMSWASEHILDSSELTFNAKSYTEEPYLAFRESPAYKAGMPFEIHDLWVLEGLPRIAGRVFFLTEKGEVGLAPHGVQAGDVMAVFLGFDWPMMVRPVGDGTYRLIGQCYVLCVDVWNGSAAGVRHSGHPYSGLPLEMITLV